MTSRAPQPAHALDWPARLRGFVRGRSILGRLVRGVTAAILVPALLTALVGIGMLRARVYEQAQAQVNSDLRAAQEIYASSLERLKDTLRVHATRRDIYGALQGNDARGLAGELDRIRLAEHFDVLTLTDGNGSVLLRGGASGASAGGAPPRGVVARVLRDSRPVATTEVVTGEELALESALLAGQAAMTITPVPRARPRRGALLTSGLMLTAAAPVVAPTGRLVGVLYGGVLLNRNHDLVDRILKTVFDEGEYKGRPRGTATIFQDDVRISTNVRNVDGTRAIGTQASAEVAARVLDHGTTWKDRAFVVNDWYLSAYSPIRDVDGSAVGMLYVGVLERPYNDSLVRTLLVFLGITLGGAAIVQLVAVRVARRISEPIHEMAEAARHIASGDFSHVVQVSSTDELGALARRFNTMTTELERADRMMRDSADELERKVELRTADLRAMQAHLVHAEKLAAVGKLSAGVAHEISNPLTGILTNASLILEDLAPDHPLRDDVQAIVNETLRCRKIVKGLLDFSRQSTPQRARLQVNEIVEDVVALVRHQAVFDGVTVSYELDPDLPTILADADQLRQVVLNLVLNAAEAMAERGGLLRLSSRGDLARAGIEVRCADSGPGLTEEAKARMFEPFFTTKKTGTGLGLSIAHGIVERHHGRIVVEPTPGGGTTFVVTLPISGADDSD